MAQFEFTEDDVEAFREALDGNIYELTPRRRNYLILRLDSFISDGAATYDPTILTIEHVLPQTVPAARRVERMVGLTRLCGRTGFTDSLISFP